MAFSQQDNGGGAGALLAGTFVSVGSMEFSATKGLVLVTVLL